MGMSLYEITDKSALLMELLEDGEIDNQTYEDTLESLDADTKVENICKVIRNLEAKAEACKTEKDRLAAKQKTAENGVARLKESLLNYMLTVDKKKIEAGTFTVSTSVSKSVEVLYEDMLDEKFFIPQPDKIDKTAITKAIKAGEEVAGAQLVEKPYIRIK